MRRLLVLAAFLGMLLAVHGGAAGQALWVHGDCGSDDWSGTNEECATPDGPKRTIQAAVDELGGRGTVQILPGVYGEVVDVNGIAARIQLVGMEGAENTIIDATGLEGSVVRSRGSVLLRGLTLTGGSGTPDSDGRTSGGGLLIDGGRTVVYTCIINGNSAYRGGGVAIMNDADATLAECIVEDNHASSLAGGVIKRGEGFMFMNDTVIRGNSAPRTGGMFVKNAVIESSIIEQNTAESEGAGLWLSNNTQLLDSIVRENIATGTSQRDASPGGIYTESMRAHVLISRCRIEANSAVSWGGGIFSGSTNVTVSECVISENRSEYGAGFEGSGVVIRCLFLRNHSTGWGGGLAGWGDYSFLNCIIEENTADGSGGGIWLGDGGTIGNCLIVNNSAAFGGGGSISGRAFYSQLHGGWEYRDRGWWGDLGIGWGPELNRVGKYTAEQQPNIPRVVQQR